MKKVSIIIPVYNAEEYLRDCLESCIQQKYENMDIIIVDDASTDRSKIIACEYSLKYDNVKLLESNINRGTAWARNEGVRCSEGSYIGFLDADDIYYKTDSVSKRVKIFEDYPHIDVVGSYSYITQNNISINDETNVNGGNFLPMSSVMIRRECFDYFGYFDESYRINEDLEFLKRIFEHGAHGIQIIEPLCCHRYHDKNKLNSKTSMMENLKEMDRIGKIKVKKSVPIRLVD